MENWLRWVICLDAAAGACLDAEEARLSEAKTRVPAPLVRVIEQMQANVPQFASELQRSLSLHLQGLEPHSLELDAGPRLSYLAWTRVILEVNGTLPPRYLDNLNKFTSNRNSI